MADEGFNHFAEIAEALRPALAGIVDETADALVWAIQEFIHINGQIETGAMVGGMHKEDGDDELSKNITSAVDYWVYQNYGTRFIPARPFVEPAIEEVRPEFEAKLAHVESRLPH